MLFNQITHTISVALLILTGLYTLLYSGITGVLFVSSIILLFASVIKQFEIIVALGILTAIIYTVYIQRYLQRSEGFQSHTNATQKKHISQGPQGPKDPSGVYNPAIEGFEDVQPQVPKDGASQSSSSASTALTKNQVSQDTVEKILATNKKSDEDIKKDDLQSATNTLFKVGKMPSEHKDGPNLDAGQTIMSAMQSLDPNTANKMSKDTKELLNTQQGLMNMLKEVRPIIQEGQQLMQTFTGMFGGGSAFKLTP
jgi:hypothetical protein